MKVCLVNVTYSESKEDIDYLGLASITAYLRSKVVETYLTSYFVREKTPMPKDYDLYGLSLFDATADITYELAEKIKEDNPNAVIFVGGYLATSASEEILRDCKYIDFIVLGDGEETVYEVVDCLSKNEPINMHKYIKTRDDSMDKQARVIDLSTVPSPANDYITSVKNKTSARIYTSKGCCANCAFCSTNLYCKKWCGRPIDDVVKDILEINRISGIQHYIINDGSFEDPGSLGKKRIEKFCNKILDCNIPFAFRCFFRAETFSDKDTELVKLLKRAGFTQVYIGIESANQDDLSFFNKNARVEDNYYSVNFFKSFGIDVHMGFLMFNPVSTLQSLRDNYQFLDKNNAFRLTQYTSFVHIYYKSGMYHKAKDMGLLIPEYSYKNTLGYKYLHKEVVAIANYVGEIDKNSTLINLEFKFYEWVTFINYIRAINPDIEELLGDYYQVRNEIAKILSDYFYIICDLNDLSLAESKKEEFFESLSSHYIKGQRICTRIAIKGGVFK